MLFTSLRLKKVPNDKQAPNSQRRGKVLSRWRVAFSLALPAIFALICN
jgi:hypothetical protein